MRNLSRLALTFAFGLLTASCASSGSGPKGTGGSGGSSTGSGGSNSSGGSTGSGGSNNSGGTTGTGGSNASGGSTGTGGVTNTGGTIGTGGTTGTGGMTSTGGTTGTGGTTATGGTGGHAGSSGTGGTTATGGTSGSTGGSSGAVLFSDDFESTASGKQPAGWDNLLAYNHNATNPMGNNGAVGDATHTHNSSKMALHITSDGGQAFLERQLPSGTKHIFVRAFVYSTQQLGMGPSSDNHESLIGITNDPTHTQLRFGQMKGAVGTSLASDDNLSPPMAKWNMAPIISANTWHCIEVEFDGTAAYNALNGWSDSTLVHSITQGSDWDHGAEPATWMTSLFGYVQIGWESFSSESNSIWIDDLVVSSARVGCN